MAIKSRAFVPQEHLDLAQRNENLARGLIALKIPSCDWAVTACFYSALHYTYYKLSPPIIFNSHSELEKDIKIKFPSNKKLWTLYKKLQNNSENARYRPYIAQTMINDRQLVMNSLKDLDDLKKELGI